MDTDHCPKCNAKAVVAGRFEMRGWSQQGLNRPACDSFTLDGGRASLVPSPSERASRADSSGRTCNRKTSARSSTSTAMPRPSSNCRPSGKPLRNKTWSDQTARQCPRPDRRRGDPDCNGRGPRTDGGGLRPLMPVYRQCFNASFSPNWTGTRPADADGLRRLVTRRLAGIPAPLHSGAGPLQQPARRREYGVMPAAKSAVDGPGRPGRVRRASCPPAGPLRPQ